MAIIKIDIEPYKHIPKTAAFVVGDFIRVVPSTESRMFFIHLEDFKQYKIPSPYNQVKALKEKKEHYKTLVEGCFEIQQVVHGLCNDKDFGIFYAIRDEKENLEYIPQIFCEFVF